MKAAVDEARAILALFARSPWRDLHFRSGGWEMFLAKPGGGADPMRVAKVPSTIVNAPHLGLFFARTAVGEAIAAGGIVGELEVLGEREEIVATAPGRVVSLLAADGALVEYGAPLARLAG